MESPNPAPPREAGAEAEAGSVGVDGRRSAKSRPTEVLPTDRIAFSKQLQLLIAYAALYEQSGQAVSNAQAGEVVGLSAGTTSLANAFFAEVGFLSRAEGGYVPSREVLAFRRVMDWDQGTAALELAPLVEGSWFAQALLPKLALGPMPEQTAMTELSKRANASVHYRPQLRTLIDYLIATGVVFQDGDQLRRSASQPKIEREPDIREKAPPRQQEESALHPFVRGLIDALPEAGTIWPDASRDEWIEAARAAFNLMYTRPLEDSDLHVKITPGTEGIA